jgi:hypothetical protein
LNGRITKWKKNGYSGSSHYFRSVSMKSGSGSRSPDEDLSKYQPSRSSTYGDYTSLTTHSQCRRHQSEQNYPVMLTMEPLDTAKHRRRPCRPIHSLRLPDEQRHRRGTTTCAAPVGGRGTARTPHALPGPASPTSHFICTRRLCTAGMNGHT